MARAECQSSSGQIPEPFPVLPGQALLLGAQRLAPVREQACAIRHFLFSVASRLGVAGVIFSNCLDLTYLK